MEQDGGRPMLSDMMIESEAPIQLDDDDEEEDNGGTGVVVDDEFSPKDAH